jgi:dipeptidyl aminopeptidase/acylaminoacyl peptidase
LHSDTNADRPCIGCAGEQNISKNCAFDKRKYNDLSFGHRYIDPSYDQIFSLFLSRVPRYEHPCVALPYWRENLASAGAAHEKSRLLAFFRMPYRPHPLRRVLFLLLCAASIVSLRAQEADRSPSAARVDEILASFQRARTISQVAVSPDGKRLAWSEGGQIQIAAIDNVSRSEPVAASLSQGCNESDFTWSPDSSAIAFLSDCADPGGQQDVFVSHLDGNLAHRFTALHGDVTELSFSPDGKRIAFLYVEGATRPAGALAAQDLPTGVIGVNHAEVQRIAAVPADTPQFASPAFISPPDLHVYEFDWSPDSQSFAYIAADPPGEDNWWVARLYTQRLGGSPTAILNPSKVSGPLLGLQIAVPRWSPDEKSIAFIGGLMSDQGVTGGDVWIVPSAGGQPRNLTPNRSTTAEWITWGDSSHIYASELAGGDCQLVRMIVSQNGNPASFGPPIFSVLGVVSAGVFAQSLSFTTDRSLFVFQASSFEKPPEIYAAKAEAARQHSSAGFASLTQITHFNENLKPSWGETVSLNWTNENRRVQGWLLLPANYDPARTYPLIVEVHGGPAAAELSHWGMDGLLSPTMFSDLGYFVLLPNPRGSFGQGEAFTEANRKDFGYGDLRDITAGVDAVLARYPVDSSRVGITGWSYGGFMTMFAVTQSHRFHAAVAGAGISDWLSYYGENSIDQWMIPYFGASVYDDPQVYAKSSAIDFIKNVSTPTLSLVGDRDGECPAPQSFEFWHALRDLHVPADLVVYPNEGHGLSDPAHRRDVLQRAVDWFARYMPPRS